ncbi:MAG: hypothetical protein ABJ308_06000 [Halieaceae bacterium]
MSDNPIRLEVAFKDEESAERVREILEAAQQWIFSEPAEERYLGEYIAQENEASAVQFSSYWVPSGDIQRSCATLQFECVGSPGDDWPDDIVVWLGKQKAVTVKGSLTISGTGDVVEIHEVYQ